MPQGCFVGSSVVGVLLRRATYKHSNRKIPDMSSNTSHSTAKALKLGLICIASGVAMAVSAVAGAWMQSQFDGGQQASALRSGVVTEQSLQQADYIRENVGVLAAKLGDIQARLIAIEGLGRRLAGAAGVSYIEPEIQAGLEQSIIDMEAASEQASWQQDWSAESLGRELDLLERRLAAGGERLGMLDTVLTQRAGLKESLPSLNPVDQPYVSSSFGWRRHPVTGRHAMHEGLDFAAPRGTPILAASGGVVTEARYVPGYGKMVEINHGNGVVTRYAHASSISVKLGELVTKGQQIARVGSTGRSTGNHLHYEVRVAGYPLDPTLFLENDWADTAELTELAAR